MDAERFDRIARLLVAAITRRTLTRAAAGLGIGAAGSLLSRDVIARKRCGPCRTKKKGKCRGAKPNGTACPGGQCFNGQCNANCCGAGCATRCAAAEVCADPADQRCAPICDDACEARTGCGCAAAFDTGIDFCNVNEDLATVCATPECDAQDDCAPDGFCATVFCAPSFSKRCLDACPG
jgi:hypothetical protein